MTNEMAGWVAYLLAMAAFLYMHNRHSKLTVDAQRMQRELEHILDRAEDGEREPAWYRWRSAVGLARWEDARRAIDALSIDRFVGRPSPSSCDPEKGGKSQ